MHINSSRLNMTRSAYVLFRKCGGTNFPAAPLGLRDSPDGAGRGAGEPSRSSPLPERPRDNGAPPEAASRDEVGAVSPAASFAA